MKSVFFSTGSDKILHISRTPEGILQEEVRSDDGKVLRGSMTATVLQLSRGWNKESQKRIDGVFSFFYYYFFIFINQRSYRQSEGSRGTYIRAEEDKVQLQALTNTWKVGVLNSSEVVERES